MVVGETRRRQPPPAGRFLNGKEKLERRYYLSNLRSHVDKFSRAVRGHWAWENLLHWALAGMLGEDQNRAATGNAAENLAAERACGVDDSESAWARYLRPVARSKASARSAAWTSPATAKPQ